ncbi:hypothetical protein [Roseibium sp. RKSG952]|uniref:hypothetical protein n=1 Tax=Roseibium sp. RKSG952 TaxID=2529384 RepID=UPI0012BB63EC|nr:hypothetical protein [Roseibium sp. RKSG952]MTH95449.1 hypothetical protein [Roseibium sp. RKSG952]
MIFEQTEPTNEPVILLAMLGPDKSSTLLLFSHVTENCARISHVSADDDGLFAYSEDGYVIRAKNLFNRETIDEILNLDMVSALGYDDKQNIVFNNLELEVVQPALTSAPGM